MEPQIHESSKPMLRRIALYSAIWLALMSAVAVGYILKDKYIAMWQDFFIPSAMNEMTDESMTPSNLYLSLATGDEGESHSINSYVYNTKDSGASLNQIEAGGKYVTQISFSPNREWVTFISLNGNLSETEETDPANTYQVFRANLSNSTLEDAIANAEQITDIGAYQKNLPSINNRGEVLFVSRGENVPEEGLAINPEDWSVHYVDTSGAVSVLGSGLYPQWYDDSSYFYLADSGIYHQYIDDGNESRIYYLTGTSLVDEVETSQEESVEILHTIYTVFDLSDDGTVMIVSTSVIGYIDVLAIEREDRVVSATSVTNMSGLSAFWPQISPDNQYVGLLQYDPVQYGIYSLDTFELIGDQIDLNNFDGDNIFITDWR